ncbi:MULTISPECIES: DMT family transporter [unclassified Crossiella]|uniref:DMT family transporter n=1 Tax=unclassified Crossiella TaxID=2620835 RepID=UPI002494A6F1|nr:MULTISPECIES: multidrug efflux SMR transporter [unclassified Crossiella]
MSSATAVETGSKQMAWTLLIVAGLFEIIFATALKQADGFSKLWPSVIGISCAAISFFLLSVSLKTLPVGTGYAVWVGIGAVGVALAGIFTQGDSASPLRFVFLALIVGGIIGLRFVEA